MLQRAIFSRILAANGSNVYPSCGKNYCFGRALLQSSKIFDGDCKTWLHLGVRNTDDVGKSK